ncbi:MAG: cytochrome c [Thermogutta sp.]|uniref:cytochrome c n=1 Tax=Thermogutta sp. TaxID=1962930 RepID=UPI00198B1E66|nr:cytochrome c [Thermogutta sp.]MBC7352660.1 cytochrome c [Thermogutta sp.]
MRHFALTIGAAIGFFVVNIGMTACAGDIPPAPKASTYAPAADLVKAVDDYIDGIAEILESEEDFKDLQSKVVKDAETVAVLALVLGLHDENTPYKAAAPALIKAARELSAAAAKDYASAKKALAALQAAKSAAGDPNSLKWEKVASLKELMEQVPLVNSRLKRNMRRFERQADVIAVDSAVIAAIAQGSMANLDETSKPENAEQWFQFCAAMRDAAAQLNKAAKSKDTAGAEKAVAALAKTCDDCHAVFHPEALGKTE